MIDETRFVHDWPASRVLFGPGTLESVPAEVDRLEAKRVLLISSSSARSETEAIVAGLGGDRVVDWIDTVVMHVPRKVAAAAAERADTSRAQLTVCVGGGSAIGLAKGVAKLAGIPILAVPTTYSGSEMTSIWGITDNGRKVTGRAKIVRPQTVVYDPALTHALPLPISVTSAVNAIAHSVEALYSPTASPLVTLTAAEGVRALSSAMTWLSAHHDAAQARADALRGAWLAGWSLQVSQMGLHHRICHVLGGLFDLPHSPLHTVVLPYVTAFTAPAAPEAMRSITQALAAGVDTPAPAAHAGRALWELIHQLGAPTSLQDIGMPKTHLDDAITALISSLEENPVTHPRGCSREDARDLLTAAWTGLRPETT